MRFNELQIAGVFLISPERKVDARGYFGRIYCDEEFGRAGLCVRWVQSNVSFNCERGTLRGMHFQRPPAAETKLVRCVRGAVLDVAVDVRPESPTYLHHVAVELSTENGHALYIPKMFAHGYQTLLSDTEVMYHVDEAYAPRLEDGLRHDDPRLGINWPLPVTGISEKDRSWPLL